MLSSNQLTLQDLWQLLQPSSVMGTQGRYNKCLQYWSSMDAERQQRVYHLIQTKLQLGQFVHPNPCFALNDAMQEDECQQAKQRKTEPTFLRGDEGGDLVQVKYNGLFKICTRETAEQFGLEVVRKW